MLTTYSEPKTTAAPAPSVITPRHDPSVPRHLAVSLDAESRHQSPSLKEAAAALDALLAGCAERGVAVLTLLHPPGDAEIFEAALASVQQSNRNGVQLNVRSARDGRAEIVQAVRELAAETQQGSTSPENIDAKKLEEKLSTHGLPAIDLFVSTGNGSRLSGALLWQCAYAELLFLDVPWFAFTRENFNFALADYAKRCRKFGGLA